MTAAPELAVYVHWPFCRSKCPYCDFNSHVRERIDEARWRRALLAELDHFAALVPERSVGSIFFGGGTPSLMAPATAAALIDRVATHWSVACNIEVTLEANPGTAEVARFQDFRAAGINRLSLGVQALDNESLRFLGRIHDGDEAIAAVELAARIFPRFSFDLIYARPGQTEAAWRQELRRALSLAGEHLSAYQLTIEAGTQFHTLAQRGEIALPDDDLAATLFDVTQEMMEAAGLPAYEISNHARPGAECRHNLIYWRSGEYVGVGPGAHGRLDPPEGRVATRSERAPETWLAAVEAKGHGSAEHTALTVAERIDECLIMGLRLVEGVERRRFQAVTGQALDEVVDRNRLRGLVEGGLLIDDADGLRTTAAGRKVLNALLGQLLPSP